MLCYVMLCYVMLCYVMLCYKWSWLTDVQLSIVNHQLQVICLICKYNVYLLRTRTST